MNTAKCMVDLEDGVQESRQTIEATPKGKLARYFSTEICPRDTFRLRNLRPYLGA